MKRFIGVNLKFVLFSFVVLLCQFSVLYANANEFGGISGTVYDKDFDVPLYAVQVQIAETAEKTMSDNDGNYFFGQVKPGKYTLVFTKEGFISQSLSNVAVSPGQITNADTSLVGEFTEMEEFVVQELEMTGGTEIALINLRMDSPSLMGSIGYEQISQAGASTAADAIRLVPGATTQEGKYANVRGLPGRYVNSQLNGIRLPTADENYRAVQLDQFPAPLIESIQINKTFTPDQQGDASGGAVNVVTKGIPEDKILQFTGQMGYSPGTTGINDFLTYKGGGVNFWGKDDGSRDIQTGNIGHNWTGAVGTSRDNAPIDYKWSLSAGNKYELENGAKIGGFATFFYEQNSSYYDDGIDDKFWLEHTDTGNKRMTPQYSGNGSPSIGGFTTSLFDTTQGSEEVKWGTLGTLGWETDDHSLNLLYMYTRSAQDVATLAEDTTGKASLHKYWPEYYGPEYDNYDPSDPYHPANQKPDVAPYIRTQTLQYTERTTQSVQLKGTHKLLNEDFEYDFKGYFKFKRPEFDWRISFNYSELYQPDKRQFGSTWIAAFYYPVYNIYSQAAYGPYKPTENNYLGWLQRIWKNIREDDKQYSLNLKFPFKQWNDEEGYLKFGYFNDKVNRKYNQDTFSNFNDNSGSLGEWDSYWSDVFPSENHPVYQTTTDVDYKGDQDISAMYYMLDLPLFSHFDLIGGHRFERTDLTVVNQAEKDAAWNPPPSYAPTKITPGFYPNGADVKFSQNDILPSIGFEYSPVDKVKFRGSYSETIARQTFKELTPIQQMEYLGADVFVGFPGLKMSSIKNYDLRFDYSPYSGGLLSLSYFYKDIKDPIEYVQVYSDTLYTTATNYPKGTMSGVELELRQDLGKFWDDCEGLTVGANATFIGSEVTLPPSEAAKLSSLNVPISKRDMTGAPKYLYNLYFVYDIDKYKTQVALFYTVKGDTLAAGAGQSQGIFIPSVYDTEYGTLNLSLTYDLKKNCTLKFQAKNITNPSIEKVYRSKYIGSDVTKSSYKKGVDLSLGISYMF